MSKLKLFHILNKRSKSDKEREHEREEELRDFYFDENRHDFFTNKVKPIRYDENEE